MRFASLTVVPALMLATAAGGQSLETAAPFAYVKDLSSGLVLFERGADEQMPPASMAKMMTVLVAFDLIDKGKLTLDQKFTVRPETWRQWHSQGSTMFLSVNEEVSVEDLLHGIVTASGNDASVVLAEGIAGTEKAFSDIMDAKGKEIGLTGSEFETANGWPHENEHVTPHDLAVIAERTILDHPELYKKFYDVADFTWGRTLGGGDPITQPNRNPILNTVKGADGLKTGHTEAAGYGFTGSAARDGRRIVAVISGLTSESQRKSEATRIMEWAFGAFEGKALDPAKAIAELPVHMGSAETVSAVPAEGAMLTVPRAIVSDVKARMKYRTPVAAPLAKGDEVGELIVSVAGLPDQRVKLVAAEAVEEAGFFGRVKAGFSRLFD
ncbi:D-alanyl-D-alanine carboxypeptidase family protein [Pacificimonas pallii]|nr:D-alanyl-D-alanine carboxypeptidase family protein [Pacificimonas pallii]